MKLTPHQADVCQRIEDAVTHVRDGLTTFDEMLTRVACLIAAQKAPAFKPTADPHSYDTEVLDGDGTWYYDLPHRDLAAAKARFEELEAGALKARIMRRDGHLVLGVVEVSKI